MYQVDISFGKVVFLHVRIGDWIDLGGGAQVIDPQGTVCPDLVTESLYYDFGFWLIFDNTKKSVTQHNIII